MGREIVRLGDQTSLATSKATHGVPFYGPALDSRPVPARLFLLCGPLRKTEKHVLLHDLSGGEGWLGPEQVLSIVLPS